MATFNLTRSVDNTTDLVFICQGCGNKRSIKEAKDVCCPGKLYKVARFVWHNPYRSTSDMEDGIKINNPGTQGEIGESGFGSTNFRHEPKFDEEMQNNYLPTAGSPETDRGFGENASSDAFLEDGPVGSSDGVGASSGEASSPFSKVNNPEPVHTGPHNMRQHGKQPGDLFERIRNRRKDLT